MNIYDPNKIETIEPQNFSSLLNEIKKRPLLFLPKYSIWSFKSFLHGYEWATKQNNIDFSKEQKELNDFAEWIKEKFEVKSNQGGAKIIEFQAFDERAALDLFFELYQEWRRLKEPKV
ncbi:MAG: hypothetical protein QNJ38_19590 [Prochloraceae cyanobacterium]|nr:hypothetical protein [Prochloraceae cyanobacterium]